MAETRKINNKFAEIGKQLIQSEPALFYIRGSRVRIAFLESEREKTVKGRQIGGECEKVPEKYKWVVPYDFTITVFLPNVERFTDKQLEILILHELLHVGIEKDGNEERYSTLPHDYEEFKEIIDRYGIDWSGTE